jgi:hypothetical protein
MAQDDSTTDFRVFFDGKVSLVIPETPAARAWLSANLSADTPWSGKGLSVEPRFTNPLLKWIEADGLAVTFRSLVSETPHELWWRSHDGRGELLMGQYSSELDAADAITDARLELLAECGTEQERQDILAGRFGVQHCGLPS